MAYSNIVHFYAFDVAEAFISAQATSVPMTRERKMREAEEAFRELAEALGYEVAKIVTPADEAV